MSTEAKECKKIIFSFDTRGKKKIDVLGDVLRNPYLTIKNESQREDN